MKQAFRRIAVAGLMALPLAYAQSAGAEPYIRLADLVIDRSQVEAFKGAAVKHIDSAIRDEPGVLAIHVVAEKTAPDQVRVFEMYADAAAYEKHLASPHFKAFASVTSGTIKHRQLLDVVPVYLGTKRRLPPTPLVRVAELQIAPAQLAAYKAAVTEEIEASIRLEPGVGSIYAVSLKDDPTQLRFLEIYADEQAYRDHIASPHFKKYVATAKEMITGRRLIETEPIAMAIKPQ